MPPLRYILCPIDFSETSRHALQHATALASWYHSTIVGLHVFNPTIVEAPIVSGAFGASVAPDSVELEARLREWLAPAAQAGIAVDAVVVGGHTAPGILAHAAALPADMLVMGTHGLSGFDRLLLGSVTEKVMRKAKCPVLTVPPPAVATSQLPFQRLLCPVDFSAASMAGVQFATSLAVEAAAHLTLLHVFEWTEYEVVSQQFADVLAEFRRDREARTRERLDSIIRQDTRNWCAVGSELAYGKAHEEIMRRAVAGHADLIVIGTHGRDVAGLLWFGSTVNHVVRQASCPVLTVRG